MNEELLTLLVKTALSGRSESPIDNHMIGRYVIVRCRDAGVHAGYLESHNGRECVLTESRRMWRWTPAKGAFLSACAKYGIDGENKIGTPVRIHLTENCEIIECSEHAEAVIRQWPSSHE